VLEVLRTVDDKFVPAPGLRDEKGITRYTCPEGLRVEFLTPAQGSDDIMGQPVALPALGGAAGEPLRFLDYLLHEPIRTVILHKGGIPVLVPQPQRYAIHKLIVATRRRAGESKEMKDLLQASSIAAALLETRRQSDLLEALQDAESRGPHWKEALAKARKRLTSLDLDGVEKCLETG
jgi:hypothetical protein